MKIAKKTLSVFLSFLMVFSACSVALTALPLTFNASASQKYQADRVYELVTAAVKDGSGKGAWTGTNYTFTGDNGLYLEAAKAVFDYAYSTAQGVVNASDVYSNGGTFYHSDPNSPDTISEKVIADVSAYGTLSAAAQTFIKNVVGNGGTTYFGWKHKKSANGSYKQSKINGPDYSTGRDVTTKSNVSTWPQGFTAVNPVVEYKVDMNNYLARYNRSTIGSAGTDVTLWVKFNYKVEGAKYAKITGSNDGKWYDTNRTISYTSYTWSQFGAGNDYHKQELGEHDTTTVNLFKKYLNLITEDMLKVTYDDMLEMSAADLKTLYDNVTGYLYGNDDVDGLTKETFYVASVCNIYFPNLSEYYENIWKALNVVLAKNAMDVLDSYIGLDYDNENEAEMSEIYTKVSSAWKTYETVDVNYAREVIESYEIFKTYGSLEAFEAACISYNTELYKNLSTVKIRQLRSQLAALIAAYGDKVADPYVSVDDVDTELVVEVNNMYLGYEKSMNEYSGSEDSRVVEFYYEIFNDGDFLENTVRPFSMNLKLLLNERNAEADADSYLATLTYYATSASVLDLKNAEAMARYDELEVMDKTIQDSYNAWKAALDNNEDLTKYAFRVLFENNYTNLITDALAIAKAELKGRNDAQIDLIDAYSSGTTDWSSAINIYNFAAISNAVNTFDRALYDYCLEKGWVDAKQQAVYASFDDILAAVQTFKANDGFISSLKTQHIYDEKTGLFNTRYAGNQTVPAGEVSYFNDIAREGAEKNYDVTKSKVEQTIVKIDNFLISNDFSKLIGLTDLIYEAQVKRAEANGEDPSTLVKADYENLSEVIPALLENLLFTDDMVNKIFALVYPMLANLINDKLGNLDKLGIDMIKTRRNPNSTGYLDLTSLNITVDTSALLYGKAQIMKGFDLYLDAKDANRQTVSFRELAEELGLLIYPASIGNMMKKNYPQYTAIANKLIAAGDQWEAIIGDDGDIPIDFEWNVNGYDDFINILSIILKTVEPLIGTLFFDKDFSATTSDKTAYANGDLQIKNVSGSALIKSTTIAAQTYAGLTLKIGHMGLYKGLYCKILDAIGIHDYRTDVNASSNVNTIAHALIDPIMSFVNKLAGAPLQTILDVIPNVLFILSMDKVSDMINSIPAVAIVGDININWDTFDTDSSLVDIVVPALKGTLNSKLKGILDLKLNLAETILGDKTLAELIGMDYTDINILISQILTMVGYGDLTLPTLDVGKIISTSTYRAYTSKIGNSTFELVADKADILYYLLQWVVTALGTDGVQDFVFGLLGDSLDESVVTFIKHILNNVGDNADDVIAALIELFLPGEYDKMDMDWFKTDLEYLDEDDKPVYGVENFNEHSIVYLAYENDWTREKSAYLMNNVDAILESVLEMTGSNITSINELLQTALKGIFTNKSLTGIIKELVSLGYTLRNDFIYELFNNQLGLEIRAWAASFADLFPDVVAKYEADPKAITDFSDVKSVINSKVTGRIANETYDAENNLVSYDVIWSYDGKEFADGDIDTFFDLFCAVAEPFATLIGMFLNGTDFSVFDETITIKGYKNYANSIGMLFEILGINEDQCKDVMGEYSKILNQDEYDRMSTDSPMDAFNYLSTQLFTWVSGYLLEGNTVQKIIELIPRFTYFAQSNGLSTVIHNLLMPILVLLDEIRPIIDIDLNGLVSTIVTDILNSVTDGLSAGEKINISLDIDSILTAVMGTGISDLDPAHKTYSIDLNHFTFTSLLQLVDTFLGTNFTDSQIMTMGVDAVCASPKKITGSVIGKAYGSSVDTADALTILISSLLESLDYEASEGCTNGEVVCAFVQELIDDDKNINVVEIYNAVMKVIGGVELSHQAINWGYYISEDGTVSTPNSVVYLEYMTDWTGDTAKKLDDTFDELIDLVLKMALGDDKTIATLLNGVLEDKVYSDEILKTVVEMIVNAIANLDETLRDLVDVALTTEISAWFKMCDENVDEEGKVTYTLKEGYFNIDNAADKKTAFIEAVKEVLAPANPLLSWLFFGDSMEFFTGTKTDSEGNYTYDSIIKLNGGEGYDHGIVPLLEALGCTTTDENGNLITAVKPASAYYDEATGTYDAPKAVADVFEALLGRVDAVSGKPAHEVLQLLPNILFFINADGLKAVVNNILAPVDGVLEALSPVIAPDGGKVSVAGFLVDTLGGLDISDLTMYNILTFVTEKTGLVLTDEMYAILGTFFIGEATQFMSANNEYAYQIAYTDNGIQSRKDMITIILSFAVELFTINDALFADLLPEDGYDAIIELLKGHKGNFTYADPNWAYMYGEGDDALAKLAADNLPERAGANSIVYVQYTNNWNEATASYLNDNLKTIIEEIVKAARNDGSTIGMMLDAAITDGLYKDAILDKLLEAAVKALAGLDKVLVDSVGAVLDVDIDTWFNWCDIEKDADGNVVNVTCTKDWGIDSKETNAEKRDAFIAAFTEALAPANRVLAWIFLGEDYTFLNSSTGDVLITISGGEGYDYGIVPVLEGLGCSDVKAADDYLLENGTHNVSAVLGDTLAAICERLTYMCSDDTLGAMLEMLPNVVYFINAGGLKAVVNNILQPVYFVLETLSPLVGEVNLDQMIGFPLSNITFETIFDLVAEKVHLNFREDSKAFVENFYMGQVNEFESANGRTAYYMTYSDKESRREMITILLSLVLENIKYEQNQAILSKWFGTDVYNAIIEILKIKEAKPMAQYEWLYMESADTGVKYSAIETSGKYVDTYGKYWTKDKAQYVADNLDAFVGNTLCLLGLEIEGKQVTSLENLIDTAVSANLYTQDVADKIINALRDVTGKLTDLEPYGEYIQEVLYRAIGLDINAWNNMTVNVIDGDRASFEAALVEILTPAMPLLRILLGGEEETVSFFIDIDGEDQIVIPGSEGYAYGLIPLLEALDCEGILTPAEFKGYLRSGDDESAVKSVLDPLFDRIEAIEANPVDEIINMLPGLIYFINSNGLDTSVKNLINTVDTFVEALEPMIGAPDVLTLLGIDLSTYDFEWIVDFALDSIETSTGYDLKPIIMDAVAELTVGTVVTYESKNGETYCTMEYASELDKADMVTVALRVAVDFITMDENIDKIKALLANYITDENNYKSVCAMIDSLAEKVSEDPGMGEALYVLYYVFYGINNSLEFTDDFYHDANNSWKFILKMLENSNEPLLNDFAKGLKSVLGKYLEGIFDEDGVAPNGFIKFFQKIAEFFKKIAEFFKKIFGAA